MTSIEAINVLQVFKYHSNVDVRVAGTSQSPLFCAKDVCLILGIKNHRDAITRLKPEETSVAQTDSLGGKQQMTFVTESGLYRLIFTSQKKEAEVFRTWVFSEVLPAIRKTGSFELETKVEALEVRSRELESKVGELSSKRVLRPKKGSVSLTEHLIERGIFTKVEKSRIYSEAKHVVEIEDPKNSTKKIKKLTGLHHPDKWKFQAKVTELSRRISAARKIREGKGPDIRRGKRANYYTLMDYKLYGNAIIDAFIAEHGMPTDWGVDLSWGWGRDPDYVAEGNYVSGASDISEAEVEDED
jgi:prophage antirepressor-like protein